MEPPHARALVEATELRLPIVGVHFGQGVVLSALPTSLGRPYGVALLPGGPVTLAISSQGENAILRADLP
jgi:hypothetical protein